MERCTIKEGYSEQLVGHLSRDSLAIAAREELERPPKCKSTYPSKKTASEEAAAAGASAYHGGKRDFGRVTEAMYGRR